MKKRIKWWSVQITAGLLGTLLVFLSGCFLAQKLSDRVSAMPLVQKIRDPHGEVAFVREALTNQNSYTMMKKYLVALVDSTIRFEELPSYSPEIPLALLRAVPPKVEVTACTISGNVLEMDCISPIYPEDWLIWDLEGEDPLEQAFIRRIYQAEDGRWKFSLKIVTA